jgi:hypothetical protein
MQVFCYFFTESPINFTFDDLIGFYVGLPMQLIFQLPALSNYKPSLNYNDKSVWLGSCFAENIGKKLNDYQLPTLLNPQGIVFNPLLIFEQINQALSGSKLLDKYLFEKDNIWFSYLHHGSIYGSSKENLIELISQNNEALKDALQQAKWLVISAGTAWLYQLKDFNLQVANCHKQPSSFFAKNLVQPEEIINAANTTLALLKPLNPQLQILISVSPVKYLKWGAHENNLGKSSLLLAFAQLIQSHNNLHYFPSFEIMQDELRDYRFYESDFAHPNPLAITYIWEKFKASMFDIETLNYFDEYDKIQNQIRHKTLHPDSNAQQKFRENLLKTILQFKEKYPLVVFDNIYTKR